MNKTAIKNFAICARNKLIADISYRAGLMGITADGIHSALPQSTGQTEFYDIGTAEPYAITGEAIRQRKHLVERIRQKEKDTDYKTAYKYIIEEVAYTWFNRLIAVRFMEVNDYLPSHIRVLSSDTGKMEPDLVTTPFDAELEFTRDEQQTVLDLKNANKLDEVFRMLFIKQCNALNEILPALFEKTNDYTELLLNVSVIDQDGVVYHLVHDIPEEDFDIERGGQVEIIGWLYQYYISEKHDEVIDISGKGAVSKEDLPAATQLFTTDWVVRYLIDNTIGRYWIERNKDSKLSNMLEFYAAPKKSQLPSISEKIAPQDVTLLDPCVGSGHFLLYGFDVLINIYKEYGYSEREAASEIIENNIFGLDIDSRATQLAYFSVMMKARQYDRRFFTRGIQPHVYEVKESNDVDTFSIEYFCGDDSELIENVDRLLKKLRDAKEFGSILDISDVKFEGIRNRFAELEGEVSIFNTYIFSGFLDLVNAAELLSKTYAVVATNPPYHNKYDAKLREYLIENFNDYKGDLFSVFIHHNFIFCKPDGYSAFMAPFVWMFIKTYEKLRNYVLDSKSIVTLVQMEYSAYEEATVPICCFVLKNGPIEKGFYFRLSDFKGGMEFQKIKVLEAIRSDECDYFYEADQRDFSKIPGTPIAYWLSEKWFELFDKSQPISEIAKPRVGQNTGDNERFLRLWHEIDYKKIGFGISHDALEKTNYKWIPYSKGGAFRRWYGNYYYVINWENNGKEIKDYAVVRNKGKHWSRYIQNLDYMCCEGVTWSDISSNKFACRYLPEGFICDVKGSSAYPEHNVLLPYLAFLNSNITYEGLKVLAPTISFQTGDIGRLPFCLSRSDYAEFYDITEEQIRISKADWDSVETSWDFDKHPLIRNCSTIQVSFNEYLQETESRFLRLKDNEERLNSALISLYELENEVLPQVDAADVTVRIADIVETTKSLLSYAVGCMFGRYSLDVSGLAYAGGDWDSSKYTLFLPDADNVIPITDEEYLEDDIVSRLCTWLKVVYGESTLEENLDFIAKALGNKGSSSREIIRSYFLNDFFKDHCQTYSVTGSGKRPIYWLFDSGKQNGFKALIYLHRYNEDTIGNLRIDYLHRMQRVYESEIGRMQDMIDHSTNAREVGQATKRKDKLTKQLKECREYDEKLAHLALSRIELDLDDGVKVNYRKVQTANDGKFYEVLADSKNIMAKK